MRKTMNGGLPLPALSRPGQDEIDATSDGVRDYLAALEQRAQDLSEITSLLREMDVFPDMMMRIDALVRERREQSRAAEIELDPAPGP